jgi:hypothetical protein
MKDLFTSIGFDAWGDLYFNHLCFSFILVYHAYITRSALTLPFKFELYVIDFAGSVVNSELKSFLSGKSVFFMLVYLRKNSLDG